MNGLPTVDVASIVNVMRKQGIDVSVPDVIQTIMESDDTYSVNDGNTIHVYQHGTDDLLMVLQREAVS